MHEIRSGPVEQRTARAVAGGRRRRLVQYRKPVPRDRSRVGRRLAAQVLRLLKRLAARSLPLVERLPAAAERPRRLGAATHLAQRLDEALSPAGDAADRAVDPRMVELAAAGMAAGPGDVVPALSPSARPASPGCVDLLQHRRLCSLLAAQRPTGFVSSSARWSCTADVTVCVSRLRAHELQSLVPDAAGRIHHVPHGAPTPFLAPQPLFRPAEPPCRSGPPAPPLSGLYRLARGSRRLGADGPDQPDVSRRLDHRGRPGARAG